MYNRNSFQHMYVYPHCKGPTLEQASLRPSYFGELKASARVNHPISQYSHIYFDSMISTQIRYVCPRYHQLYHTQRITLEFTFIILVQFARAICDCQSLDWHSQAYCSSQLEEVITRTDTIILVQCPFLKATQSLSFPFILHASLPKKASQEATPVRNHRD